MRGGLAAELLQILAFGQELVHQRQRAISGALVNRGYQFVQYFPRNHAEKLRRCASVILEPQ